jgi:hypothetical protein
MKPRVVCKLYVFTLSLLDRNAVGRSLLSKTCNKSPGHHDGMYRISLEVRRNAAGRKAGFPEGLERKDQVLEPPKTISSVTENYLSRCLDG